MAQSEPLPPAFDLGPLLNTLLRRTDRESRSAGFALKNFRDAQSAVHDLIFALEVLEFLKKQYEDIEERAKLPAAVRGACLSQVILLYVRATEATNERRSLKVFRNLNAGQKELHKKLVVLRNKVIAHLDRDRSFGAKSFVDERLVVVHARNGMHRLQVADMRVVYQQGLETELRDLLWAALKIAEEVLEEKSSDAGKYVSELSKKDPKIAETIERHPFDSFEFFGDEKVGRAFIEHGFFGVNPDREALSFDVWPDPR